ncbi:hypothetical protein D3C75_1273360 [compost metagenome]
MYGDNWIVSNENVLVCKRRNTNSQLAPIIVTSDIAHSQVISVEVNLSTDHALHELLL